MAIVNTGPGSRPDGGLAVGGKELVTEDLMKDERFQPTTKESMVLAVGKAHRQVVYYHYEMRNYRRGDTNKSTV